MICPKCGFKNLVGEKYCSECGSSLQSEVTRTPGEIKIIRCRKCGTECSSTKKYCSECGASLTANTDQNVNQSPTQSAVATGSTPTLLPPNTVLQGRYRITKLVGQGGMGAVYLAEDKRFSNRISIVKEMLDHFSDPVQREIATKNFAREADMLAKLRHEGIPEVYDRFDEGNRHYLVMEYIEGTDLEQKLLQNDNNPLDESDVLGWATQICDLLSYLHHQNPPIIYRDMKPANLIETKGGRLYMIDFGIARFFNPVTKGTMIGTQGYAPPEQYRGKVDPRSDIYALGATLHHLLTGRDPQSEAPFSFPPVRELNPKVSVLTEKLISKSLEMEPENRFSSADEMLEEIMKISLNNSKAVKVCPHCNSAVSITKPFCPHCNKYIAAHTAGQPTSSMLTLIPELNPKGVIGFFQKLKVPEKLLTAEFLIRINFILIGIIFIILIYLYFLLN